jgi:hypothetical protein
MRGLILPCALALAASLLLARPAFAQQREFQFGIGYGHLFWDGFNSRELKEQGGVRVDGRVTWCADEHHFPQLRVGAGATLGFYVSNDNRGDVVVVNDLVFFEASNYTQLSLFTPELEVSWRQWLDQRWYLEPGAAATFLVGNYVKGEEFLGYVDEDIDRWRVGGGGRAFVRLGYNGWDRWSVGLEGSYAYGWLDFGDDVGGDIQQAYLGIFAAYRF